MEIKKLLFSMFLTLLIFSSCREEGIVDIVGPNSEPALKANTKLANLMLNIAMNDGSNDNIIDNASCFNLELPVTVNVNGLEITVDSEEDFDTIEAIFDEFENDKDSLRILFPVTIILSDYTEIVIHNQNKLDDFMDDCFEENETDDDIECLDFQYPIKGSVFNTSTEQSHRINIMNDNQLYRFLEKLDRDDLVTINFPIIVVLFDGTTVSIDSLAELVNVIEVNMNECDEDDDNDYNDDDCNHCNPQFLSDLFAGCSDWTVDKLELNDINDLEDNYIGYHFNFSNDGTITVQEGSNTYSGTWSSSGTGNNIIVVINIPALPDFNASWNLHEATQNVSETKIDLRLDNKNRLRFESTCI